MNKDATRRVESDLIIFFALLILLFLILRLWPAVILAIIGVIVCALIRLFRKPKPAIPELAPPPGIVRPDTEHDLICRAFALIQRRISETLSVQFPDARWVWAAPNSMGRIAEGTPVFILLNRAGGYRRAEVQICHLQFKALRFETAPANPPPANPPDEPEPEPETFDYGLLAFEWVEANSLKLNQLCNDAIATGDAGFTIPAVELPVRESWQDICDELVHNGFTSAEINDGGITITHTFKT